MTVTVDTPRRWIGKSIPKVEDRKFLLGRGNYVDDLSVPGMLHAATLRSPHAHARIVAIDAEPARRLPGVAAVVTCLEAMELCEPMPDFGPAPDRHAWRCMASDKVRFVGEPVAAIVATSRYVAEDARDLIEVEYELLDPVIDATQAMGPSAPLVHEEMGSNVAIDSTLAYGDVEEAFASAAVVVRDHLYWGRTGGQPLETVASVASYDPATGLMTIHSNSVALTNFLFLLAKAMKIPANKLDLHPHPAGGSFGSKFWAVRVNVLTGMLSKVVGRPVKYVEDRLDNLSCCDHHGSERSYDVELAVDADGLFTGLRLDVVDDYGAYIQFGLGTHGNAMAQVVGPVPDPGHRVPGAGRLHEQMPAGRLPGIRLRGAQLRARAHRRPRGTGAGRRSDRPAATQLHPARAIPLQDPGRQRVRQRQLRCGARQGARARRPPAAAARAGAAPERRPLRRHRHRHVPGTQRLRGERVVVLRPRQGHLRLERSREHHAQRRRDRRRHRDALLDSLLGQQRRDGRRPVRRRGARRRAGKRHDQLRRNANGPPRQRPRRKQIHGHDRRRHPGSRDADPRQGDQGRRAHARDEPG